MFKEPWKEYINLCAISTVGIQEKTITEKIELCITVGFRKPLLPDLSLPSEYKGVKVFTRVIGEISLL